MKETELHRKQSTDYQLADKYYFCEGCEHKLTVMKGNKVIRYSCPARFDPYESNLDDNGTVRKDGGGCPKNAIFLKREKAKQEGIRGSSRGS